MSAGLGAVGSGSWLKEFEQCKELAQEVVQLIQERNLKYPEGGQDASRMTASARRKIGTLGTLIEKLVRALDAPECATLSESEKNRRRDLLYELRNRREQMQHSIKRSAGAAGRNSLFEGASGSGSKPHVTKETDATAELETSGLLGLQQQIMSSQDQELEQMEKAIGHTKHVAIAINGELDLQARLLEDLEEDVDVSHTRIKAVTLRVKQVLRSSNTMRFGCIIFVLIVALVASLLILLKVYRLFGL
ncbi:MAG: hypothetical protein WDW38_003043 [Sanguina aurantia]